MTFGSIKAQSYSKLTRLYWRKTYRIQTVAVGFDYKGISSELNITQVTLILLSRGNGGR